MTGSMMEDVDLTISAYNEYVEELKISPYTTGFEFTLSVFNSEIGINNLCSGVEVADIPELNGRIYRPDANTPLYDAIGKTIREVELQLHPDDGALVIIQTDGFENASQEFTSNGIKALVTEKQESGWQFVLLGCGIDADAEGRDIGIPPGNTLTYGREGSRAAFARAASSSSAYARRGSTASKTFFGDPSETSPFFFIQLSDPQFGLFEKQGASPGDGTFPETALYEKAIDAANRLQPEFVVVTGDLVQDPSSEEQHAELMRISRRLNGAIPIHFAAGNCDVGNTPTIESLRAHRDKFGADNYSFDVRGTHFVVLNSSVCFDPSRSRPVKWCKSASSC